NANGYLDGLTTRYPLLATRYYFATRYSLLATTSLPATRYCFCTACASMKARIAEALAAILCFTMGLDFNASRLGCVGSIPMARWIVSGNLAGLAVESTMRTRSESAAPSMSLN